MSARVKKRQKLLMSDRIFNIINTLVMVCLALIILYPLYFVVLASVTDPRIVNTGKLILLPKAFYVGGYMRTFQYKPLWTGYLNSFIYTASGTLLSVVVTVSAGYVLSRADLYGRRILMLLFTFTMFFNGGMIPSYLLMRDLGIYNTFWVMVLPGAVSVWNLIVCRTFFETTLPSELLEAARIDGCSDLAFFFRIALPLSSTIIAVMALFYGSSKWNSYFDAMIYLTDSSKMPLQIVLRNLLIIDQTTDLVGDAESMAERQRQVDQIKYCVIVVSAAPMLILYPFVQKYFAKGVMIGAVKG